MIERKNHGRGHSYRRNGRKIPGVTTIIGATMPKPALIRWAGNSVTNFAVDNWDRLAGLPVTERIAEMQAAPDAERDAAARRGTEVHALAEALAADVLIEVPDELAGHVDSYRRFLDRFRPEPIAIELVVAHSRPTYCGTADLVALMLGEVWLLELKTGRSGIFRESALQACAYSRADVYTLPGDHGRERPLAELGITRCGAVHVRSDGYDVYPLNTGEAVWRYFRRLCENYAAEDDSREWIGEVIEPLSIVGAL